MAKKKNKSKTSDSSPDSADEATERDEAHEEEEAAAASSPEPHDHADGDDEHAPEHGHGGHAPNRKEYWTIFGTLAGLTALEVGIAYLEETIGKTALIVALVGLAFGKAGIVANFFMHLKHETKVMKWTVVIPLGFIALYAVLLIAEGMFRSLWVGA